MGQLQKALTIFQRLRAHYSEDESTPCNDKVVELALANHYIELKDWYQFDQMQLDEKGFTGPEVDLSISIRYFRECIYSFQDKEVPELLNKAIHHAEVAIEKSQSLDASSFSQLGHCIRIVEALPASYTFLIDKLKQYCSNYLFDKANKLDTNRKDQPKDEVWRDAEHAFLERLSRDARV